MQLSAKIFAKVGSERITQYSLVNDHQMTLRFLTFGARVQQVRLPNAAGDDPNLLLGFVTLEDYLHQPGYLGAFTCPLQAADAELAPGSWQNWNWAVKTSQETDLAITFTLTLPENADGQPGQRELSITHRLTNDNLWQIDMQVATTADLKIHPRLNLPWLLTADPAQTMLSAKLTADEHVTPVPKTARCETAQRYSLAAADWQLAYLSDASFTRIDSYAGINSENNFNGILGQPNVAVGFSPEMNQDALPWVLPAGATWRHHAEFHLSSNAN
ncbi:Aldose 1-epimerase precursor [Lacticaseibacillus paracasei]|uniref:aldose epimerase n=1 Tax=Lacticaseibacillus paracasei TaxID=1597 RepID=UPI000F43CE72|nr:aldose epimerase [Lacticaseibacillus paracasei]RND98154.1 Aldose 1-epimerase precursor [Lacticaseibacillus paracasei]